MALIKHFRYNRIENWQPLMFPFSDDEKQGAAGEVLRMMVEDGRFIKSGATDEDRAKYRGFFVTDNTFDNEVQMYVPVDERAVAMRVHHDEMVDAVTALNAGEDVFAVADIQKNYIVGSVEWERISTWVAKHPSAFIANGRVHIPAKATDFLALAEVSASVQVVKNYGTVYERVEPMKSDRTNLRNNLRTFVRSV